MRSGTLETSVSIGKHAVLNVQVHRWGPGHTETCTSGPKALFCVHKTTGEGWNPYRLVILVLSTQFLHAHILRRGLVPIKIFISSINYTVLHSHNDRWGLGAIENCDSAHKVAVLHAKTTGEGLDPFRLVILMLSMLFYMYKITGDVRDP